MAQMITIGRSNIVTAFDDKTIGSKVTNHEAFHGVMLSAVERYDFETARIPGQGFVHCPEAVPFVVAGVGRKSTDASRYQCREHRGHVGAYLKREFASPVEGVALIVYTKDAYLKDPDIEKDEFIRIYESQVSHVLVAVLAFAGDKPTLTPHRFVQNLAGGNREALDWTADEIRAKASEISTYGSDWSMVAD